MAIAKLGGINFDQLTKEWGYDPAEIRTLRHGIKRIGTKNGMSLDRAGQLLAELGYLSRDQHGKHDLSELFDLFDGELRGDPHYTPQGFERKMEGIKEPEYQAWLEQQDKDALNAQTDEQQEAIETFLDEYNDISPEDEARIEREAIQADSLGTLVRPDEEFDPRAEEGINRAFAEADQEAQGTSGTRERAADVAGRSKGIDESDNASDDAARAQQNRDDYTIDMFGAIPETDRTNPDRDDAGTSALVNLDGVAEIRTAKEPSGRFGTIVGRRSVGEFSTGITAVGSAADAAHIVAALRKSPQEIIVALVTDEQGKPIEVIQHQIGDIGQTNVNPGILVGAVARVPGAKSVWLAHNHPSGHAALSKADITMSRRFFDMLENTGLEYCGLLAMAGNKYAFEFNGTVESDRPIPPMRRTEAVKIVERTYKKVGWIGAGLTSPQAARAIIKDVSAGESGIAFTDMQNRPIAFVPMSIETMANLRATGGARELFAAIEKANAANAFITTGTASVDAARDATNNMADFFEAAGGVRLLDVFDANGESRAEKGTLPRGYGKYRSRGKSEGFGLSVDQIKQAIAVDPMNRIIDVYASMDDLPYNIKRQAEREGVTDVEGFYDDTTNRVALVASNLASPQRAIEVARHELIGHYGIENMLADSADPGEMKRLIARVIQAERDGNKVVADLAKQVDETQPGIDAERRAKEIIAIMAERNIQNSITKRVLDAIRKFLNKLGVIKSDTTDADIAEMLRKAHSYLRESGRSLMGAAAEPAFSRSAMKSVDANVKRGKEALQKALLEKTTVHRAMHRNDIGWIDFAYGDEKRGIVHILHQRMTKDGMSESEAVRLLVHGLTETIAKGAVKTRTEIGAAVRLRIQDDRNMVVLVRMSGANAWMVTGFEVMPSGEPGVGFDTTRPTQTVPTRTRHDLGADGKSTLNQNGDAGNGASFSRTRAPKDPQAELGLKESMQGPMQGPIRQDTPAAHKVNHPYPAVSFSRSGNTRNTQQSPQEQIAGADSLYKFPKSRKTTVEGIAADNDPRIRVRKDSSPGPTHYYFTMPEGQTAHIVVRPYNRYGNSVYSYDLQDGEMQNVIDTRPGKNAEHVEGKDDVWINVSSLKEGSGYGAMIYNIAATYAHNTGKVLIGDPQGLSDAALRRFTEHMLSSALKFGTTEHLAPHLHQVQGDAALGVPGLDWIYGDHEGNIRKLIDVNLQSLANAGGNGDIAYNTDKGQFEDADGNPLTRTDIERMAEDGLGREAKAGGATLARHALFQSLVQGDGGQGRSGHGQSDGILGSLVEQLRNRDPDELDSPLRRILYVRRAVRGEGQAKTGTGKEGLSVAAVRQAIAADTFHHDVDVYATLDDAPPHIRAQAHAEGATDVEGFWDSHTNRVALIAANLASPQRAAEVARHELIGHYGLENMVGAAEMERLAQRVIQAEKDGNKTISQLARQVDETQPELDGTRRAKEIIAVMAERHIQNSVTKRVLDAIRKFLKSIGFIKQDITDAEIARLLREAQDYLKDKPSGGRATG